MEVKKIIAFLMLCAYALATIGGFGYAAWGGSWPVAISVIILAWMAYPKAKEYFLELTC